MLTEIPGITVGHWTDEQARTGCTVVRFPEGTVASGEVRGGAPATREFALLDPTMLVQRLDAVVLSGGSAFGLAAADGVMVQLEDEGVGFETAAGRVPIVVGMSLFDLGEGDGSVRPGPDQGRAAAAAATAGQSIDTAGVPATANVPDAESRTTSSGFASSSSAAIRRARSTTALDDSTTALPPIWSDLELLVPPPRGTSSVSPRRTSIRSIAMPVTSLAIWANAVKCPCP